MSVYDIEAVCSPLKVENHLILSWTFQADRLSLNTGGILFSPEKAVEEVSHVIKTAF